MENSHHEGFVAFGLGFARESNPYTRNPQLTMWSAGWEKAEDELVERKALERLAAEGLRAGQELKSVHLALEAVRQEIYSAKKNWPEPAHSAHEQYAVLLEEVDELWDHVKTKQKNRDLVEMRKEAIQVAAMAIRFATEVCDEINGRR